MNKRGFTLVELLAVIIILGIISTIISIAISDVLNNSKNTINNIQINDILSSAYDYSLKKLKLLPDEGETNYILLNELKKYGFIENNITDAKTKKEFSNDLVISIRNVGINYKNTDKMARLNGRYLYKIESITEEDKKPKIIFEGYESVPVIIKLNIKDDFEKLDVSAKSFDGDDLTKKIIKNITFNSNNIDKIDTSKIGIYYIDYCVVDKIGNSTCERINITIIDEEEPELTIPDSVTISTSVSSYNLMDGVKCEDNSGICEIEIEEDIKYGEPGKYIVYYKAYDPSGKTVTKKRVITIE